MDLVRLFLSCLLLIFHEWKGPDETFCYYKVFSNYFTNVIVQQKHVFFQPQFKNEQTRHKKTHSWHCHCYSPKIFAVIKSSSCVKTRPRTHRPLPTSWPSFQLSSNPSGRLRKFSVHFSNPCCKTAPFFKSHLVPARRRVSERSVQVWNGVRACVLFKWRCLWNTENMRPPLIGGHVAANISSGWWDQCFLSLRASVSSLSLVLGQRLSFFSSRRHDNPTIITQLSHPLFFFFSLTSHFFQAHVLISREVWGSQHGPFSPPVSQTLRGRKE